MLRVQRAVGGRSFFFFVERRSIIIACVGRMQRLECVLQSGAAGDQSVHLGLGRGLGGQQRVKGQFDAVGDGAVRVEQGSVKIKDDEFDRRHVDFDFGIGWQRLAK